MKDIDRHMMAVRDLGCVVCLDRATLHHPRSGSMADAGILVGAGQKQSDWLVLPLCWKHHVGDEGIHVLGVRTWEAKYGTQMGHLDAVSVALGYDVFTKMVSEEPGGSDEG